MQLRLNNILVFTVVAVVLILGVFFFPNIRDKIEAWRLRSEFTSLAPLPQWWDEVTVSGEGVHNVKDLRRYWQSKGRSGADSQVLKNNQEFFKAAYSGIVNYPLDDDLIVEAIWLMNVVVNDYPQLINIQEFAIKHYFYHDHPTNYCVNCMPADPMAWIVNDAAYAYVFKHNVNESKAVDLIFRVLKERGEDISPWLQVELYERLAWIFMSSKKYSEGIPVIERAIESFKNMGDSPGVAVRLKRLTGQLDSMKLMLVR